MLQIMYAPPLSISEAGGNVGVAGLVINKDDGTGEAAAFAKAADIPVLASIPQDDDLRKNLQIIKLLERPMGSGEIYLRSLQKLSQAHRQLGPNR